MGGNDKLQLALDIVFNDSDDDNTNDSSPRDHGGNAAHAAAGEDNCAPPALRQRATSSADGRCFYLYQPTTTNQANKVLLASEKEGL